MTPFKRALAELDKAVAGGGGTITLAHAPDGFDAFIAADIARARAAAGAQGAAALVHVARDAQRSRAFQEALAFAAPQVEALDFPAWDCQPYDRASPNAPIAARRMTALARLARTRSSVERPRILCTTVDAILQRTPPRAFIETESLSAAPGNAVDMKELAQWLEANGFLRSSTVRETGEYAVPGG